MREIDRVIPLSKVVETIQKGIKRTFDCDISFYNQGVMIFTFNYKDKPVLQLRVSHDYFELIDFPRVEADDLLEIATVLKNAHACMTALQVAPKG